MKELVLTTMEFKKGDVIILVPNYQIASIRLFIEHYKYRTRAGDPIYDFKSLTQEDLDYFNLMAPVTVTTPIPGSSTYPPPTSDPAMRDFNRGINCDPNHFKIFSNERNWLDYKDHTIVTANSQNIEEVLDPTFVPINGDTVDLFTAKQKCVFSHQFKN